MVKLSFNIWKVLTGPVVMDLANLHSSLLLDLRSQDNCAMMQPMMFVKIFQILNVQNLLMELINIQDLH